MNDISDYAAKEAIMRSSGGIASIKPIGHKEVLDMQIAGLEKQLAEKKELLGMLEADPKTGRLIELLMSAGGGLNRY